MIYSAGISDEAVTLQEGVVVFTLQPQDVRGAPTNRIQFALTTEAALKLQQQLAEQLNTSQSGDAP